MYLSTSTVIPCIIVSSIAVGITTFRKEFLIFLTPSIKRPKCVLRKIGDHAGIIFKFVDPLGIRYLLQ